MAAIVFPRPPPTYNTLSPAQRAQLLRSSAKLGQILGSTPHILDETEVPPRVPPKPKRSAERARSGSPSSVSSASSSSSQTSSEVTGHSERSWRARFGVRKPPMLRVGKTAPPVNTTTPPSPTLPTPSPEGSPTAPSFAIPSDASMKRQKMRRIAKKLGEGVPVHLVFPPSIESDEGEVFVDSPTASSCSGTLASDESAGSWEAKDVLWEKHTARRSKFAANPVRSSAVISGRYVVHYHEVEGTHGEGEETFGGLGHRFFSPIPEE